MRLFPNKNQLSNFLDTVRGLDVSCYDLFVKIDDDDSYSRDYCRTINDFHRMLPPSFSSYHAGEIDYLNNQGGYPFVHSGFLSIFGPTIVFNREVLEKLFACERHPENIESISKGARHTSYGFHEDSLMHIIMKETGCCNRAENIRSLNMPMHAVIRRDNSSVMRGGLVSSDFWWKNQTISNSLASEELVLEIRHECWHDLLHVLGRRAMRLGEKDTADVLFINSEEIVLKWDRWGMETFMKEEGTGVFIRKNSSPFTNIEKPKTALLIVNCRHSDGRWRQCLDSCRQYFLNEHEVHYYVLTDEEDKLDAMDVTLIRKKKLPLALKKLNRFHLEQQLEETFTQYNFGNYILD